MCGPFDNRAQPSYTNLGKICASEFYYEVTTTLIQYLKKNLQVFTF